MNGPFQVAQANIAGQTAGKAPARIVKIAKPFSDQSVVVALSYDGSVKADLSSIAGEKITLVHIGEKLIILFDNKSTVTLEPFFDSTGKPLDSLTLEVSPGRNLTGAEFAALFPVTEDQSVLPAAGDGTGNAQASGANFSSVGVDPLALPGPLDLLGQEELPNFVITALTTPAVTDADLIPSQITGARVGGVTEEEQLGGIIITERLSIQELLIQLNAIGSGGKEDPNDVTLPNSNGTASDGLDQDTTEDSLVTTQFFHGDGANALTNLVASGNPPLTFTIDAAIPNSAVIDGTGAVVKSAGHELHYSAIDTSVAGDNTIVGGYSEGEGGFHEVFRLTIHSDGTYDFELLDKIDHPVHTTDAGSSSNGHLEETLFLDFTTLVHVADLDGDQFTLTGTGAFTIGVIDDTPEVSVSAADAKPLSLASLDESIGADLGDSNATSDDVAGNTTPDPLGLKAIGEVESATGALANLFSVTGTTGEDGFGAVDFAFTLTLGGAAQNGGVATSLSVTDPSHVYGNDSTIYLFSEGGQIVGRVGAANGAIALRISIDGSGGSDPTTAHLVVDQYLPVNHGADGNNFDSSLPLTLVGDGTLGVTLTTTVTDGDGDVATSAATVTVIDSETTPINIEDDGPTILAGEGGGTTPLAVLDLDETIGADRYNTGETESNGGASNGADDKAATVTVSIAPLQGEAIGELSTGTGALAGLFTAAGVDFGTDGPAAGGGIAHELSLVLSSETVGTSLTATALVGTSLAGMMSGQRAIELVQVNATTIEGRLVGDGIAANGDEYVAFRLTLENPNDLATAKITVDQFLAIDHGGSENPSVFDEQTLLTLIGNGALDLKLVTTVTDGDGDHASLPVQVNLIGNENSFIAFDDDGPKPLSISATNGAANGLFFDGFVPNNFWGAGSGTNSTGAAGAWHISASPYEGASTIQLERVGDNYRGSDSPTNSVMVDLEATPGNVQVSQDLTLTPGAIYHLTFEIGAANDPGIANNSAKLEVFWNGTSVGIYTPTSGVMQTISIDVTAAGANNQLTFREIGEAGDNTGTFLANVKLSDVIIIDETKGVDADSDDTTGLGSLFATVPNGGPVGVDPDMDQPQYAQGSHSVVVLGTPNYGTDGPAATNPIQIGLSVSSAGVDSGLTTTAGKAIHLYVEGALVVGRFDSDNNGSYDTAAFALSIDPNGGILSIAQYVSLHHPDSHSNDEGVYLAPGTVLATVTLTDGDGDRNTTSADISNVVRFEDDGPSIDPLQNSSLRDWTIDEDVLPAAGHSTPHGNDALDTPADTNDYTQINGKPLGVTWGADGPKALTFTATDSQHPTITVTDQNGNPQPPLTSGGVALVYNITTNADGGQTLVAYKGSVSPANEVFKLTLDPDAGTTSTFSFELTGALDHPDGAGQNTLNLRFGFTATDGDDDTASSFLTLRITDDVPYASGTVISRRVDEDDIDTPWSHGTSPDDGGADGSTTENSTGAAFISGTLAGLVAPGADLPGKFAFALDAREQLLALGLFSKESALGNGENGKPLGYVISNGPSGSNEIIITGNEPNPQGNPVFSLTLNTVTGAYEFRLFDELIHMPGDGQNDDLRSGQPSGSPLVQHSIPYLDLGSIITYTDKDGDPVNLGGKFTVTITDDVPHADIDINRNASITIDETGGNEADNTASSSVRNLFKNLENSGIVGDDPDVSGDSNGNGVAGNGAIAYAHSNFTIVSDNSTIGSDSPPYPHQYALSIVGGAASGLFVTDGNPINLSVNADGLVIGTVGGNSAGAFYGKVAFAIAIESDGEVSVAQYLSLKHDDRGDSNETNDSGSGGNDASPDDTPNPVQQNLDGKILVTLIVTDSDGDKSTDTANIGKLISFLDDGPSLHSNSTVSLEDDDLAGGNEGGPGDDNAPLNASGTLSHDYGADGPGTTLLTGFNLPSGQGFTAAVSDGGLTLIIKQNGVDVLKITLTDSTDGDYTVTQLHAIDHPTQNGQNGDDTENNVEFTVSYRVTDGDGDFTDGSLKINVDDDTPEPNFVLQSGKLVVIDETAGLQNATATPGVTGDSNDNDTSNPFPVAVTNPGVPAADSTLFGAPQVAQSNGAVVAVTPHYGADGPGSTVFSIDVPGSSTSSGLTTVSGQPITLFEVSANLIVGRYDGPDGGSSVGTNDPAAFAIHIDPATGVISVVQYVAIKHDDRGDFDENNDDGSNGNDALSNDSPDPVQQSIINSAIRVTVTVTDHDGDSVDEQFEIGSKIVFEDDGPTISITATGEAGVVLTTQDADTVGNATDTDVSAANFSGVFAATSSYGADGGGSISLGYSLAVTGTPGAGGRVDSNLDSQGSSIYLYNVGGAIVGSTALTAGTIADGNKIFSISVNGSGVVTLTQFQQIDHPIGDDPSASASPFNDQNAILGNGLISLTRSGSITDGDGDIATSSASIDLGGNIQFTDHGPSATTTAPLKVDEDDLSAGNHDTISPGDDTASASLIGTLGFTPGADTPATVSFSPLGGTAVVDAIGQPVTAGGVALTYLWVGGSNTLYASTNGTVGGAVFKIEVTNPSTGAYSFSLLGPVDHPGHDADGLNDGPQTAYEDNININLTYTVTDFDKDTATGTLSISIDDDMPILPAAPTNLIVNGDFSQGTFVSALFGGIATLPGSVTGWVFANSTFDPPSNLQVERVNDGYLGLHPSTHGSMIDMGASPGNIEISQQLSGLTLGQAYAISFEAGAPYPSTAELQVLWNNVVIGTIDPAGPMTSYAYIVNATGIAANDKITFREVGQGHAVIPGQADEGYHGTYLANVSVIATNFVDEDGLTSGNHDSQVGDAVVLNGDGDNNEATTTGSLNIQWGADNRDVADTSLANGSFIQDGALGAALTGRSVFFTDNSVSFTGASTLTSDGVAINFVLSNNNTKLQGFAGAREVFEITLSDDDSGKYRFILKDQLDHAPNGNENDIALAFNFAAKDSDGDVVAGRFVVGIDDDVPVITAAPDIVTLNEALLPTDGNPGGVTQANVGFLHISWGADDGAAKHLAFVKDSSGHVVGPALKSDGVALDYFIRPASDSPGNEQLVAVKHGDDPNVDANLVFSITLYEQGGGYYAFALYQNIDHDPGADTSILNFAIKAFDADGDAVQTALTVKVTDDVPHALSNAPLAVDEDDLSAGNHDTTSSGDDSASASLSGTLGFTAGADTPATVSFSPLGGTAVVDANGHPVTSGGVALTYLWVAGTNTLYASTDGTVGGAAFKIEVTNPSTGAYSLSLLGQVDHPGHDADGLNNGPQTAYEDNININLTYTVTDFDKDPATGTLSISIDDDMPIIGASPAPTNLILNGSFEEHGPVGDPGFNTFTAINHWTSGPDNVPFEIQQGTIGDLAPQQGNAKVELDSDPLNNPTSQLNATIQQTISTPLAAGDSYELSFWYSPRPNDGNPDSSSLKVYWNGVVVHTIDSSTQADGWQHVSVLVTAQAGSNTVAFQGDGQPNKLGAYLDNVSLIPAITVDEDGLTGLLAFGNHDSQPGDNVVLNTEGAGIDNNEATATGKLNIQWGADNIDSGIDGVSGPFNSFVQDSQNGVGDRSVTFTNANVAVTGVPTLYSHGDAVTFELNSAHTVLSGKADGRTVFEVSLTDEDTGQFRFVLFDKLDHAPGNNENDIGLSFNFTATDSDGDSVSSTFFVGVDDDVPVAVANTGSVTEGGVLSVAAVSGVLINDLAGADGYAAGGGVVGVRAAGGNTTAAVTTGVNTDIPGLHGTLHLNADGSYTYQSTANSITANDTDVFVYTIKDGDGDLSTTTLTINLTNSGITAANDSDVTVYEKALDMNALPDGQDLAVGTVTGSLPGSPLETDATSNQLTATSSVAIVSYELVTGGNAATAGAYGTIKVASDGSYIYTLTKPVTGPQADDGANIEVAESFQYKATDASGNTALGTITVNIVDDVPTVAIDNSGPADPTTVAEAGTITGDWNLTPGADGVLPADFKVSIDNGAAVAVSVGAPINTGKGSLTFNANGSWTFVAATNLDNTVAQSVTFTLSAKDRDGDTSADSHTISITDGTNPSLSGGGLSLPMDDQNLSDGSTPANPDAATGTVSFTAGSDALTTFAFAAGTGALAGGLTWNRVSGILIEGWDGAVGTGTKIVALALNPPGSIAVGGTGSVTVTATLVNNYDSHPGINLDDLAALGSIGVVASDHDGDSVTQTVTLSVSDDLPALNIVDTPAAVNEGQTINGTWTLAPGADGVTSVDVTVNATTQSLSLTPSTNVVTFNLATGTLTVDADLQWHFTANSVASNQQVTFSIKATDGDNDTSSDSQTITIQNVIQPLVIAGAVAGVVEEEHGLPGGIDDTTSGTTPTNLDTDVVGNLNNVTNAISGSFGTLVTGGVDGTLSYSFATLSGNPAVNTVANGPLTSDGKPVLFAMDSGNLIGYVNSDGGIGPYASGTDTKIFTVTLNSTSGAYSFTLNSRIDHPIHNDSTEDAIAINLNGRVTVTDSGGPAPGDTNVPLNASITVIDDAPVAVSDSAVVNEGQKPTMNVVFVIDTSSSMGSGAGSRMELAKAAAINLLNNSSVDFNQIMVVSFASGASHNDPIWADKADAIAYISNLSSSGNTDYDAALARVTTNWGSGPTAADQTVVYFISDGQPTDDNGTGTVGIVGAEQTAWETFLADKGVAASYAVGISTSVNDADLTPIAWAPGNPALPPVIITGAGDLSATLTGSLPGSVSGNVLSNDGFGADTGHIKSITVNGTTYTFDGNATITTSGNAPGAGDVINANGKQITIVTDLGGMLVFNFAANGTHQAGEWDYTAPTNIAATSSENFAYTLTDDDGDTVGATLNLTVNNINAAPSITSNGGGTTAAINVAENSTAVTTVAATDPDAGTTLAYSISGGADAAKFAINGSTGALTFIAAPNFESPTDTGGNNVYDVIVQVTDGALTDTQAIAVTVTNANEAPSVTSNGGGATAAISVAENSTAVTTVTSTDPDAGATKFFSISGGADAAKFAINASTGVLTFVAAPNFELPTDSGGDNVYDVTVQVTDGALTDTQAIAVTVTNVNEAPSITSNGGGATAAISVAENSTAVTTVTSTDPDAGATKSFSISGGADAAKFAINASTGVLTFVAAPNFESPTDNGSNNVYDVTVQVTDGALIDTQAIAVAVTNANEAPTATNMTSTASYTEGAASVALTNIVVSDVDAGDAITATLTLNNVAAGVLTTSGAATYNASTGVWTITGTVAAVNTALANVAFTPATNNDVDVTITTHIHDAGNLGPADGAITLDVTPVNNDVPVITSNGGGATAAISVVENSTAVTTVTAIDPDTGSTLTYSIIGGNDQAKFAINASTGVLTFVTAPNAESPTDNGGNNVYNVTVQVSDGALTDTQAIAVTVTDVNEFVPVITSGATASVAENVPATTLIYTATATDADAAAAITYSITGADAALFNINATNGQVRFNASPNFEAPGDAGGNNVYDIIVHANDGTNDTTKAVAISVTNVNEAPVPVADNLITNFGGNSYSVPEWVLLLNDSDPEGNAIDVNGITAQSGLNGSVNHTAGTGTNGTIDINDNGNGGTGSFAYNVTDGSLVSSTSATVTVNNVDGGNLTGTANADILFGDGDGDSFNGAGGDDIIIGGGGTDTLTGGAGADHFFYRAPSDAGATGDHIVDFTPGEDSIDVLLAGFVGLSGTGAVAASDFVTSTSAATVNMGAAHFAYNSTTGQLYYDSNGGDASGATRTLLAILDNHAAITASDIHKV